MIRVNPIPTKKGQICRNWVDLSFAGNGLTKVIFWVNPIPTKKGQICRNWVDSSFAGNGLTKVIFRVNPIPTKKGQICRNWVDSRFTGNGLTKVISQVNPTPTKRVKFVGWLAIVMSRLLIIKPISSKTITFVGMGLAQFDFQLYRTTFRLFSITPISILQIDRSDRFKIIQRYFSLFPTSALVILHYTIF